MLDRIDIHIEVPFVNYEKICGDRMGESRKAIRARVPLARNIQQNVSRPTAHQTLFVMLICALERSGSSASFRMKAVC